MKRRVTVNGRRPVELEKRLVIELPDDAMVPMRWVRQHYVLKGEASDRLLTTGQAAAEIGFSPDTWRAWADDGRIPGAFRDESETWRLPLVGCREHVAALRSGKAYNRRQRRGWDASTEAAAPERARKGLGVVK